MMYSYEGLTLDIHTGAYEEADRWVLHEVQFDYSWPAVLARQPRTVLDLGANIGAYSAYAAQCLPGAQIVAIEPDADNYSYLCRNTAPFSRCTALYGYIGYNPQPVRLERHPLTSGGARLVPDVIGDVIPRYTLEQMMVVAGWQTIDLLKIDCEGCECDVLLNAPAEVLQRIGCIVGERHSDEAEFDATIGARLGQWFNVTRYRPFEPVAIPGMFLAVRK